MATGWRAWSRNSAPSARVDAPVARLPLALLVTLLAALAAATVARAAGPEVGIADDRVLLAGGLVADEAVAEWHRLGVDVVRIHAVWGAYAPAPDSTTVPAGFVATDPNDPGYDWSRLDAAVDRVRAAGIAVMLTVTGPAPVWASRDPTRHNPRWKPDPTAFAAFATALARRYGDRVDRYIVWNEPNQPFWLQPQSSCSRGRCVSVAPHVYRELVRAAYPAIHAADPGAQVLIGALAPRGSAASAANSPLRPLAFLRAMGCVDSKYRALRTGDCAGFVPATGDGFSYHPHGILNAPDKPFASPDDVDLASLGRLEATLDRLQRLGALRPTTHRFDLYLTEYGYQTNPPDRLLGIAPALQDRYLQQAAYIAWRDPRVKNLTQYEWRDEPATVDGSYSAWQSGLRFADGRPKPALAHFADPAFVDVSRSRVWGQIRPGTTHVVAILRRLRGSSTWRQVAEVPTDARGYFARRLALVAGASYRFTSDGARSAVIAVRR